MSETEGHAEELEPAVRDAYLHWNPERKVAAPSIAFTAGWLAHRTFIEQEGDRKIQSFDHEKQAGIEARRDAENMLARALRAEGEVEREGMSEMRLMADEVRFALNDDGTGRIEWCKRGRVLAFENSTSIIGGAVVMSVRGDIPLILEAT